jgi:uncharacterized oligopeptide transporter (OPT) family protein
MQARFILWGLTIGLISGIVTSLIMSSNSASAKFIILLILFPTTALLLLIMSHIMEKSEKPNKDKIILSSEILLGLGIGALTYFLLKRRKK